MNDSKKSKNLLKGVAIYGIGTFGTKILSFLIVPLYTYYISTEDMGLYDLLISTINLLTPIITLQISDAAYKWIIRDEGEVDDYIRSTVQVLVINCMIAVVLILGVNHFYAIPYCHYFYLVLVFSRMLATIQKLLRALKNQKLFAISGIVYTVIFLAMNVVQICIFHLGVVSLFQGALVANVFTILMIIIAEPRLRIHYFTKPDVGIIKEFYKYSVPLVPNYLNWWIINSSDRYIVAFFMGPSANGILAIAHKFPSVLQTVLNLFTTSWQDVSVADNDIDVGKYYTNVFRRYYKFSLSLLWGLVPATKVIIQIVMNIRYKSACDFVAFYYMGTVFQSFASFYGVGYLRNGKTGKAFSTSIYGAIVNAVINIGLIKFIGLQAAAFSTFIGFLCMWLIREKQNRDELGIKVKWFEFITLTLIAVGVCFVSNLLDLKFNFVMMIVGALVFFIYNKEYILTAINRIKKKKAKKVGV